MVVIQSKALGSRFIRPSSVGLKFVTGERLPSLVFSFLVTGVRIVSRVPDRWNCLELYLESLLMYC